MIFMVMIVMFDILHSIVTFYTNNLIQRADYDPLTMNLINLGEESQLFT